MTIPTSLKATVTLGSLLCLLCGCASVGHDFDTQKALSLELGKTRSSDYQAMFGKPKGVEIKDTADGKFELVRYLYAHADLGTARARVLDLEFRNGELNAYRYLSSFDKDKTKVDPDRLKEIQRGTSKKDDVIQILGNPHGKARCPTQHVDFKEKCGKGTEVWVWTGMGALSTFGHAYGGAQPEVQNIFIVFDAAGVVVEAESSQTKNP